VYGDPVYTYRYYFDILFFLIINIILMNIFFGIIIDSFASKRDREAEIQIEVSDQCFICGLKKSVFEIENENWNQHIFCDHNLHSYLAFLIYVKKKDTWECTGIEKWVKICLKNGTIDFFPINRCMRIKGGSLLE
jgi:inositol 1,4,5-triphosphate receptor type 3